MKQKTQLLTLAISLACIQNAYATPNNNEMVERLIIKLKPTVQTASSQSSVDATAIGKRLTAQTQLITGLPLNYVRASSATQHIMSLPTPLYTGDC